MHWVVIMTFWDDGVERDSVSSFDSYEGMLAELNSLGFSMPDENDFASIKDMRSNMTVGRYYKVDANELYC